MQQNYRWQLSIPEEPTETASKLVRFHVQKQGLEHFNALILILLKIGMAAMIPPSQLSSAVKTAQLLT